MIIKLLFWRKNNVFDIHFTFWDGKNGPVINVYNFDQSRDIFNPQSCLERLNDNVRVPLNFVNLPKKIANINGFTVAIPTVAVVFRYGNFSNLNLFSLPFLFRYLWAIVQIKYFNI